MVCSSLGMWPSLTSHTLGKETLIRVWVLRGRDPIGAEDFKGCLDIAGLGRRGCHTGVRAAVSWLPKALGVKGLRSPPYTCSESHLGSLCGLHCLPPLGGSMVRACMLVCWCVVSDCLEESLCVVVTWLWDPCSPYQLGELFSRGRYFYVGNIG